MLVGGVVMKKKAKARIRLEDYPCEICGAPTKLNSTARANLYRQRKMMKKGGMT